MAQKYLIHSAGSDVVVEYEPDGNGAARVRVNDGKWKAAQLERVGNSGLYLLLLDNEPTELYAERKRGGAIVEIGRHIFNYSVERWRPSFEQRDSNVEAPVGPMRITAPMTGSVVEVIRHTGETVEAGDVVLVIESMKMDNELRAPGSGTVTSIEVAAGDRVSAGQVLAVIEG